VFAKKSNGAIVVSLVLTVVLWGASNAGTKFLVGGVGAGGSAQTWPPVWTGSTRFLCGGLVMLLMMRATSWLGPLTPLSASENRGLWLRSGLSLAVYIVVFNEALHYTSASHVALYLGASPVWALIWEEKPSWSRRSARRYGAAALALSGVVVLFWPSLRNATAGWIGEMLGMMASVLWAYYGRQCRGLGARLSGAEVSAHTMWRAGLILLPVALAEIVKLSLDRGAGFILLNRGFWRTDLVLIQVYCFIGGGVFAYGLWSNALRHWPTSQVFLFNNLIPVSTMAWSHFCLGERVTPTFWTAMFLIVCGVVLGQARWEKILGARWVPTE
jgi:drug/metabolite transporter (DMT)-like permease